MPTHVPAGGLTTEEATAYLELSARQIRRLLDGLRHGGCGPHEHRHLRAGETLHGDRMPLASDHRRIPPDYGVMDGCADVRSPFV